MTGNSTHASRTAGQIAWLTLVIAFAAGVFMAGIGALGTDEAPLLRRLLFWITVMVSGALISLGITQGFRLWGRLRNLPLIEAIGVAIGIAAPLTLIVTSMRTLVFAMAMPSLSGLVTLFGYVLFVSLAMTGINYLLFRRERASEGVALPLPLPLPRDVEDTRFRDRLPVPHRAATLYALEAEDHYLRVHTEAGSTLILLRMADAVAELGAIDGAQTHRSWWVAREAVIEGKRNDGRGTLTLRNGIDVPVSRSYLKPLAAAGWFG